MAVVHRRGGASLNDYLPTCALPEALPDALPEPVQLPLLATTSCPPSALSE
ncbi:MAG TPA: hypothetical protein VFK05_03195 [Polyangiaceae bacterium]|nr:hypothetical protein [Polyangiaceae bacterium]